MSEAHDKREVDYRRIRDLHRKGKTTKEICDRLHLPEDYVKRALTRNHRKADERREQAIIGLLAEGYSRELVTAVFGPL